MKERHITEVQAVLPADPKAALLYLHNILRDYQLRLQELEASFYTALYAEPEKRREGMIRFADGTSWNPGSGEGLYQWRSGAWHFLSGSAGAGVVETPSGTIDGVNDTFTLSKVPVMLLLLWNGVKLKESVGYTIAGTTITMQAGYIPSSGDILEAALW